MSEEQAVSLERWLNRQIVAAWMMERGFATGHGDTIQDLLSELGVQVEARLSQYAGWSPDQFLRYQEKHRQLQKSFVELDSRRYELETKLAEALKRREAIGKLRCSNCGKGLATVSLYIQPADSIHTLCYDCKNKTQAEHESIKESVWPGKPAWRPTLGQPQQNFYEAFAESLHGQQRVARPLYEALKECERVLADMGHRDLACAISARAAIALGDVQFDVDTVFQRMAELGITDQDIQETMPPKPEEGR